MGSVIGASTGWWIGLVLGIVVIAVAAVIVITIVLLAIADRQAGQDGGRTASRWCAQQTDELAGIGRINDSGVRILHAARALRKVAVGQMTHARSLGEHLLGDRARHRPRRGAGRRGAARVLVRAVGSIEQSVERPARGRRQGRGEHREHPAARGDGARARADRGGGRRPGRLHERPHRRVRRAHEQHATCSSS